MSVPLTFIDDVRVGKSTGAWELNLDFTPTSFFCICVTLDN